MLIIVNEYDACNTFLFKKRFIASLYKNKTNTEIEHRYLLL